MFNLDGIKIKSIRSFHHSWWVVWCLVSILSVFFNACTWIIQKPIPPKIDLSFEIKKLQSFTENNEPICSPIETNKPSYAKNQSLSFNKITYKVLLTIGSDKNLCECTTPCGEQIKTPLFPSAIHIQITNHSQMDYPLKGMFIRLVDQNKNEYRMSQFYEIQDIVNSKFKSYYESFNDNNYPYNKALSTRLALNKNEIKNTHQLIEKNGKEIIFGAYKKTFKAYKKSYDRMAFLESFNPLSYFTFLISSHIIHTPFDYSLTPDHVWQRHQNRLDSTYNQVNQKLEQVKNQIHTDFNNQITMYQTNCLNNLQKILTSLKDSLYTGGFFDDIVIQPGQKKIIILPIFNLTQTPHQEKLLCKIYDIPKIINKKSSILKRHNATLTFIY